MVTIHEKGTTVLLKYDTEKEDEEDYEIKQGEEGIVSYHVNHKYLDETPCYMITFSGKRQIQLTEHGFYLKSGKKE